MSTTQPTKRFLSNCMTVQDLINQLEQYDGSTPVVFSVNYGDYHETMQALPVSQFAIVTHKQVAASAYSNSGFCILDESDESEFFCEACEEKCSVPNCPKCHARCVTEDGTPAENDENATEVLVLS